MTTKMDKMRSIMDLHGDNLKRMCYVLFGSDIKSEGVVGEIFIEYFKYKYLFDENKRGNPILYRTAIDIIIEKLTTIDYTIVREVDDMVHSDIGFEFFGILVNLRLLKLTLKNLPGKSKYIVCLYYVVGLKTHEIARILKISNQQTRTWLLFSTVGMVNDIERMIKS